MAQLTVTTEAQLVPPGGTRDIRSTRENAQTIWIGPDDTVSAANGYPIYPGEGFSQNRTYLWVVVESGTADLRFLP